MTQRVPATAVLSAALFLIGGCASEDEVAGVAESALVATDQPTTTRTPIGLSIAVDNGVGQPLRIRAGQKFFLDQVDLRASAVTTTDDPSLTALRTTTPFSRLDWRGLAYQEHEPLPSPNPDGTFRDRRFFRDARWMEQTSLMVVWQVDDRGRARGTPLLVNLGGDDRFRRSDGFFIRRMRAIQWANDCASPSDCSAANDFMEEALVEVRHSSRSGHTMTFHPTTTALRVFWTALPSTPWEIPVEQVANPEFDYGFRVVVTPETPPGPHGYYEAGDDITFRFTLTDGSGNRLHPVGSMPTYADVAFGADQSGIQYYRGFFEQTATYWRRKHLERNMGAHIIGPAEDIQALRTVLPLEAFLGPDDTQVVGEIDRDGVYSEVSILPPANVVFGGAFHPTNAPWFEPVADTVTFHLPENARPGTYKVTVKGHRSYLGEDIAESTTIEIQVGTSTVSQPQLTTGNCASCHSDNGALENILHGNGDRGACAGCHVPLAIELEGPIAVRTHFIHSRSDRFDAPLDECSTCHLSGESIERTSQAACLSCHTSYPDSHVTAFGPIESMYVGGGAGSFQQCTDSCHVEHPGSGFGPDGGAWPALP